MGRDSTYQRIARTFFWPAMKRTVADVVRACAVCQTKGNHPPKDQKHTLTSTQDGYAFQRISIDFVGPFPISTRGNRYILTVKDTFTRWIEAFPVANADASTVCRLLDEQIFCRFGLPERIHADNGTHFTARRLRELADILGIEVTHTPAYNPKSNPVERSHRDLGPALKVFCQDSPASHWEESLNRVLFALRTTVNRTTGLSPFQMLFGRDASQPIDLIFGNPEDQPEALSKYEYNARIRETIDRANAWARINIGTAVRRQARQYHKDQKLFVLNARVWVYTPGPN